MINQKMANRLIVLLLSVTATVLVSAKDPKFIIQKELEGHVGLKTISTKALVDALTKSLADPNPKHNDGQLIHLKQGEFGCLDASWYTGSGMYTPKANRVCEDDHQPQQWRIRPDSRLMVGDAKVLVQIPRAIPEEEPDICLECVGGVKGCDVRVAACRDTENVIWQQWEIRIHAEQFDAVNRNTSFSIHSKLHPNDCLTEYFTHKEYMFHLVDCSGAELQSFYLGLNLDTEVKKAIQDALEKDPL